MTINRAILPVNKAETFNEDVDFSQLSLDENHVKKIEKCQVQVNATEYEDVLLCEISGEAKVIASCSYTLEDVPLTVRFHEKFYFSDEDDGSDNCYFEPNVNIDLDPYILALILAEVPHNIVKKGASLPKSGEGYRVISEEEYLEEKKHKKSNAFAALDAIEFDEN